MSQLPRWFDGRPVIPVESLGKGGPLTEWLVVGPFPFDHPKNLYRDLEIGRADAIESDPLGVERTVRPSEGTAHANPNQLDGISRWTRLSGAARYDLRTVFPSAGTGLAYAATYLSTDAPTDVVLWANGMREHFASVTQLMLDGVEVGCGDVPTCVRVPEGEHLLMLKIAGGAAGRYAWQIDLRAGIVEPLGDDLGAALVVLPGFWRGREGALRVEVQAVLVNRSGGFLPIGDLSARFADGPSERLLVAADLSPHEVRAVRLSAPLGALRPHDRTTLVIERSGSEVAVPVRIPDLPPSGVLHVVEGFHCDPVWVSDQHHYNLVSLENVRQLLDGCLADPNYRVFLHEIDYLKPFVDEYPDYRAALFGLIQMGQVSLGSSYNQPNENNCSGEAIIRNILYGYGFHRKFLGGDPGIYHAWDVFGHISQLSQIAAKSGLIGILWSKPILGFPPIFRHMALDGTTLPMIRSLYGWGTHSLDRLRDSTKSLLEEKHSFGLKRHLVVDSGDFTSPSAWMVGKTAEMADSYPQVVMTGPETFLHGVTDDGSRLRVTSRTPSQYHVGTTHSRSEMKIANRLGENALSVAERWATFASLMGADYPDRALDKAWRQLLFAEHHDALSGTPCDISYLDLMIGYREALELASDVIRRATRFIAEAVKKSESGSPVLVFNPLNWSRNAVVTVPKPEDAEGIEARTPEGDVLPSVVEGETVRFIARDVPSVGYATVTLHPTNEVTKPVVEEGCVIENEFWRITLDPARGGGIASLVDRETGRELIDADKGVGNDLVALQERGVRGGSPWEFWTNGARLYASFERAAVKVERSPVGTTAIITGALSSIASYRRTLTVRPGGRTIEASVVIDDYRHDDHLFVVATPLALAGSIPVVEDRFGTLSTRRNRRQFDYRTGGNTKYSDCVVLPIYNFMEAGWSARVDVGDGDGKTSLNLGLMGLIVPHDENVEDAVESLMRSFVHAGVTCTPFYDDDDRPRREPLEARYQEPGREKTRLENTLWDRLDDLNMTNQWMAVSVAGDNRYVTDLLERLPKAVRTRLERDEAERGWSLVVAEDDRVPDGWEPAPVIILTASSQETLAEAIDHVGRQFADGERIRLPAGCDFRPQPTTLDDYGVAVLTNGTGAGAVEPDGTLTLFLAKSAPWADTHLSPYLVPEHRRMLFHYGFYPHAGNWRTSGVVRAGYEFDNPVTTATPSGDGGTLPTRGSFLMCDASQTVITAIKPAGNPALSFESGRSDPSKGIVVRGYNADGRGGSGRLALSVPATAAHHATLMEQERGPLEVRDGAVDWSFGPYAIETVKLVPHDVEAVGSGEIGRSREPIQPVWCRYWKHNANVHPIGYLPVAIFLDGELPIENEGGNFPSVGRLRVTIVNNYTDRTISGTARIIAPPLWTVLPSQLAYSLAPREHATTDATVAYEKYSRVGLVKARLEHDGQFYQDVIEAGTKTEIVIGGGGSVRLNRMTVAKEREPEWHLLRDGSDILVRVRNPWRQPLDAELAVASPVETWGIDAGAYGLSVISPRAVGLSIPGRQTAHVRFRVGEAGRTMPAFWAWMKLMCNGKPDYKPVPGTTA